MNQRRSQNSIAFVVFGISRLQIASFDFRGVNIRDTHSVVYRTPKTDQPIVKRTIFMGMDDFEKVLAVEERLAGPRRE